ncbi:NAP1-related protein 1 [Brachypodium distachyon]|uniref:Uncharacterized protein n=1 Tax=Brachypodium distachyon TaxID=15368 RepID=I1IYH0_BRADI|nr:NAP1-related protein 1 [Brachypodium distachyon]KQJ82969.1 hypothetical protein BRADI_5g12347v3 [Brachypodium distachyon]|eukprot:XP_003579901.1 NAP1-related protein 1 [Brachypodium distachyon]
MATPEQKGKRPRIDEEEEGDDIDKDLFLSVEKLHDIQDEIERVNEEASDKVLEVDQKYNEILRPVYARRNELIRKIPDFWLTAFLSHPKLGELLTEDDQKIFKHLESIDVDEFKDGKSGYSITLTFSPNPYFEDTKLTKSCTFSEHGKITVKSSSINWKTGMDIVNGKAYTKDGSKRLLIDESFFTWFNDAKNKSSVDGVDEVTDIIKEELWPNPLKYFNDEAEEEFVLDEEEDEEGSDDDDDEEEQDEEED